MRILPAPFSLTRLTQSKYLSPNAWLLSQAVTARSTTGPLCAFACEIPAENSTAAATANLKLMLFMTPPLYRAPMGGQDMGGQDDQCLLMNSSSLPKRVAVGNHHHSVVTTPRAGRPPP